MNAANLMNFLDVIKQDNPQLAYSLQTKALIPGVKNLLQILTQFLKDYKTLFLHSMYFESSSAVYVRICFVTLERL